MSKKKIAVIIVACIVGVIVGVVIDTSTPTPEPTPYEPGVTTIPTHFTNYTDELGLFSISYPPEWELALEYIEELEQFTKDILDSIGSDLPLGESSLIFAAGLPTTTGFDPNVTIAVDPLPEATWTHDEMVAAEIEGLKAIASDYHEFSRVKTTVDNREATIIDWQGTIPGLHTNRYVQMNLRVSRTYWCVTCTTLPDGYSTWEDDLYAIVRSLRILK